MPNILIQSGEKSIRLLVPEDAALLERWLTDPRVLAFYEGRDKPQSSAHIHRHFFDGDPRKTGCIIQFNNAPIGYVQFYPLEADERDNYGLPEDEVIYGMDQFIGDPAYWNRGIGRWLVQSLSDHLLNKLGASRVMMDPEAWNHRAIRAYERAGFRKLRYLPSHERHEGVRRNCWLMARARTQQCRTPRRHAAKIRLNAL